MTDSPFSQPVKMATVRWVYVSVLCLLTCHFCICASHSLQTSGTTERNSDFSQRFSIRPRIFHGREKRQISHTRVPEGHVGDLTLTYELHNQTFVLDLALNRDLLSGDYFEKESRDDGSYAVSRPKGPHVNFCHYQGHIRNVDSSWAALSTCQGLQGVVYDGTQLLYIEPRGNLSSLDQEHFLYKHSDLISPYKCGLESAVSEGHSSHKNQRVARSVASEASGGIRGPYKANSRSRYVELVLVVDSESYKRQGSDVKAVYRRCKDIANIVNALYAPLNIFVVLVGVVVWKDKDEITLSMKADDTLINFLHYRRVRLVKEHPNDNAQLLTGIQFQGGIVGKALKGPMCTYEFSGGVAMDHNMANVGLVAATVAHEMGHNFGMEHDNDSLCTCPDRSCIMAASSGTTSPTHWSSCSLENLALALEHGMDYCLRNKPTSLFQSDGPECGNMLVEPGEECDCGPAQNCDNPCCNPYTCKLYSNATCATGECCDLETCSLKTAGSECRATHHECDLPEYCNGTTEYCPADLHKLDGLPCGKDKAYCFEGSCRSHTDQCRLLWGISGKGSEVQCYKQNTYGNKTGNCGYDKYNQTYARCRDEDILCGLLHCSHLNERLEFGMESVSVLSHSFFNSGGRIIPCRTANVDLGLQDVDPGLVPNGAKCGDNKMCVNQKCVPVSNFTGAGCLNNCNNNGVCNNMGKCHCSVGYAPPYCDYPGPGGSEDGGPATNPHKSNPFVTAMYIIFLGINPIVALIICCCCYYRRNPRARSQLCAKIQGTPKLSLPTRSSPDFTRPPSSSSSSTGSLPSGTETRNRSFWPFTRFFSRQTRNRPPRVTVEVRNVDISQPLPLQTTAPPAQNGSNTFVQSFNRNLFGQYNGFTLSPLSEQPDSSFDSVDSPTTKEPVKNLAPKTVDSSSKPLPNRTSVAARANFFNGSANATQNSAAAKNSAVSTSSKPAKAVAHTEIVITKTVVPCTQEEKDAATTKRPVSSTNAFSVRAIFGKDKEKPEAATATQVASTGTKETIPATTAPNTSTLQRVTSIFKPNPTAGPPEQVAESSGGSTLPRNQSIKAAKLNRDSLRQLEISNPIPQHVELPAKLIPVRPAPEPPTSPTKIGVSSTLPRLPKSSKVHFAEDVAEAKDQRNVVDRAESMRLRSTTTRPAIPQFGSMRGKRPVSMPFSRPTAPPPNPPTAQSEARENGELQYDDCVNATESIYASIEELPDESSSSSTSDGLLLEIVSELRKKNPEQVADIYSTANKNDREKSESLSKAAFKEVSTNRERPGTSSANSVTPANKTAPIVAGGKATATAATSAVTSRVATTIPPSTVSATTISSQQGYKPFSAAAASRSRYLASSTPATAATTTTAAATADTVSSTRPAASSPAGSGGITTALNNKFGVATTSVGSTTASISGSRLGTTVATTATTAPSTTTSSRSGIAITAATTAGITTTVGGATSSILSSWWNKHNTPQPTTATTSVLNSRPTAVSGVADTTKPTEGSETASSSVKAAVSALQSKNPADDKPGVSAAVLAKGKTGTPLPAPPIPSQPPVANASGAEKPLKIAVADVGSKVATGPVSPTSAGKPATSQMGKTVAVGSKAAATKPGSKATTVATRPFQPANSSATKAATNATTLPATKAATNATTTASKKSLVQSMQQKFDNTPKPRTGSTTTATTSSSSKSKIVPAAKK